MWIKIHHYLIIKMHTSYIIKLKNTMGIKEGKYINWSSDILTMYQSIHDHYGGKIKVKSWTGFSETNNKQKKYYGIGKPHSIIHMGLCRIRSKPQYEESYWWWHVILLRTCTLQVHQNKLNTKISSRYELFCVSDYLP